VRGDIDGDQVASLPASLRYDLQAWSHAGSELMWGPEGADMPSWSPPPADRLAEWTRRGRELRSQVSESLGSGWLVGYFDDETSEIDWRA
jgi:hypothetical protein